jgi:1-acyl-sn-glycerol-3-phosphate acyltransferase
MTEKKPKMRWFHFARRLCRILCTLFFRIEVNGLENIPDQGGFMLIGNHQSVLDPVLCGMCIKRNTYYLARDTLFKNKFFGRLISSVNTMPVKRGKPGINTMKKVISILKAGNGVCLFPEGTRSSDGKIAAFKPGFGLLCRRGKAAVVPVVIDGAFECWPRHKKLFSIGAKIVISYGKCLTEEHVKQMNDRELAEKLTDIMRKMQNEIRIKRRKEPYVY